MISEEHVLLILCNNRFCNSFNVPWLGTYTSKWNPHFTFNENTRTCTVMILSFRTDRSGQTVQTQIRLLL